MKRVILPLLVCFLMLSSQAQLTFDALTFSNPYPQVSQKLSFSFDKKLSPLKDENSIEIIVYQFTSKGLIVKEPLVKKTGSVYTSNFMIDSNATALAFGISSGELKDNNGSQGYIVPIYNRSKQPVIGYYASAGQLYSGYGEYLFGLSKNTQRNLELLEEGLSKYPALEDEPNYYESYFAAISAVKKADSKDIISALIKNLESKTTLGESGYSTLINYYIRNKDKTKADSLSAVMKEKHPNGKYWKEVETFNSFFAERNAAKKEAIYEQYIYQIGKKDWEGSPVNMMKLQIADAYDKEKNEAMAKKWMSEVPMSSKASTLNNKSWAMAEAGNDLIVAKKMSEEATMYAKQQAEKPTEKKPQNISTKQWKQDLLGQYAMYADTYGFILYELGEYKEGLPFAKAGANFHQLKNEEYNERYALLLEKAGPITEAKSIVEGMVKLGKATAKTKDALRAIYIKEKKSEVGVDEYIAELNAKGMEERRAEVAKTIIDKAAPKFALKDWEGKEVSLESLKGKIVIVDFWATWCGPCIASMPGMKLAQEKLASRDDVKFLFVNTWESGDDKMSNAKEFMKKKDYPFYVLMDDENRMVVDFEVSGIPTKFIIDKKGNIRFKSIGFGGNTGALADEVLQMVELAGK